MGRRQYKHVKLTCHRGINQQRGLATLEECAEASNVWAPNGVVEQRPGYVGVVSFPIEHSSDRTNTSTTQTMIRYWPEAETPYVTYAEGATLILDDWAENHFWYLGFDKVSGAYSGVTGNRKLIGFDVSDTMVSNTNEMRYEASYWNGTEFTPLNVIERGSLTTRTTAYQAVPRHIGGNNTRSMFCFCPPGDWASSTINSVTAFFIQFKLKRADLSTTAMDASTEVTNLAAAYHVISPQHNVVRGLFVGQFPVSKRYTLVTNNNTIRPARIRWAISTDVEFRDMIVPDFENSIVTERVYEDDHPATHAVVPQFGEGFVAYGGEIKRYSTTTDWPHMAAGTDKFATSATKEDRDFAVGDEAPFDPDYIAALSNFPKGRFVSYFKNRLWAAGMTDEPFTVRWGAATPYHKVFPDTANDLLMEDDNSFITGMAPLGEHMAVFKRDSIWLMVAVGENPATQVTDFRARKVVDGTGCVSHSSIQQIRGALMFLAEDGVYVFDGTANVQKLSDRVAETVSSINPGRTAFASSAHWKSRNCYLLSLAINGAHENNTTLVYDYKNDAWWKWDIPAAFWLNDESESDEESLYFMDNELCMHLMDSGNTDNGQAITSSLVTQRIGETDNVRRTIRQVEVVSDNRTSSLTVAVRANDDSNGDASGTLSLTDDNEAKYADNLLYTASTNYVIDRNRARRLSFRKQGDWLQVFISHNTHNTPMTLRAIDVGIINGTRR